MSVQRACSIIMNRSPESLAGVYLDILSSTEYSFAPSAALVSLHAGDAMVRRIVYLDFAVRGINREALLIVEKCVAHFVLTAG